MCSATVFSALETCAARSSTHRPQTSESDYAWKRFTHRFHRCGTFSPTAHYLESTVQEASLMILLDLLRSTRLLTFRTLFETPILYQR